MRANGSKGNLGAWELTKNAEYHQHQQTRGGEEDTKFAAQNIMNGHAISRVRVVESIYLEETQEKNRKKTNPSASETKLGKKRNKTGKFNSALGHVAVAASATTTISSFL